MLWNEEIKYAYIVRQGNNFKSFITRKKFFERMDQELIDSSIGRAEGIEIARTKGGFLCNNGDLLKCDVSTIRRAPTGGNKNDSN